MSKKKHVKAELTADGFSIHTFELRYDFAVKKWQDIISANYAWAKKEKGEWFYPIDKEKNSFCNIRNQKHGIRIYYNRYYTDGVPSTYISIYVNPRKLIDPASSYLGIFPNDPDALKQMKTNFDDIMKTNAHALKKAAELPHKLDDFRLHRIDQCVNIHCKKAKVTREMIRTAQKCKLPAKYERKLFKSDKMSRKKLNEINKHYLRLACDSKQFVVYDKTYQITENGLWVDSDKLPNGVLRLEAQYFRKFIRAIEKERYSTYELICHFCEQSAERLVESFSQMFPKAAFRKPDEIERMITDSTYTNAVKEQMLFLVKKLRRAKDVDSALHKTQKEYDLSDRTAKDLLARFDDLNVSPVPLRINYTYETVSSIPVLLKHLAGDSGKVVIAE